MRGHENLKYTKWSLKYKWTIKTALLYYVRSNLSDSPLLCLFGWLVWGASSCCMRSCSCRVPRIDFRCQDKFDTGYRPFGSVKMTATSKHWVTARAATSHLVSQVQIQVRQLTSLSPASSSQVRVQEEQLLESSPSPAKPDSSPAGLVAALVTTLEDWACTF